MYTLDKYGNYPIVKAYIVRQPMDNLSNIAVWSISLLPGMIKNNNDLRKNYRTPINHTALYVVLKKPTGQNCMVCIEKDPNISVKSSFMISRHDDMIPVSTSSHKHTLSSMLDATRAYMNDDLFFNWELTSNHCEKFVYELIRSLSNGEVSKKDKSAIDAGGVVSYSDKYTEIGLYTVHAVINVYHILQNGFNYMKILSLPF